MSAPVETLRKASRLMRERATAATTERRWTVDVNGKRRNSTVVKSGEVFLAHYLDDADAAHIAGMDPIVAIEVADWLDDVARKCETVEAFDRAYGDELDEGILAARAHDVAPALTVARAYLRSES